MSVMEKTKAAENEKHRQAMRRGVHEQQAEAKLHAQKIREQQALIAASDQRVNAAVAEHAKKAAKIQPKLDAHEATMLACFADRLPLDPQVGAERAALIEQLDVINRELEAAISTEKAVRESLTKKLHALQIGAPNLTVLENRLCGIELARPEWFDRHFALGHLLEFIKLSSKDADDKIARQREFAADGMDETAGSKHDKDYSDVYERRIQTWKAVSSIGSDFVLQLTREMADLRKRMIDE